MRLKKAAALTLVTAMTASMAAACGSSSSTADSKAADTAAAGESTEEKKEEGASDEKKTLSISVWDNDATPQFTAVAEAFMAANPDVTIEFIDAPSSEYNNKVTVMLAGGDSELDVIFVKDTENQVSMKEKGQILNLDEYIKKDAIDLGMYQGVAEQLQMDGSIPQRLVYAVLQQGSF